MLKYIIAFVVIAIAWTVVYVLNLPWTIAILATLLVLFVLFTIWLYRRFKARKAAREIEKALNAQAEEQARSVRPEQQAEVRAIQAEFNRAIGALKNSRLGKTGVDALYALPWYVIIGPPGAGKSTALRNSGIPFPYMSQQTGGGVKGVGGTRNCELWLSNEGVLVDTAGRYTTDDDDRDEWFSFLDTLKKSRPRKPLNGVIVAVNVAELGTVREQQVEQVANRVRERIDEVQARLQLSLPVYVLFTKCDLVQGFTEFFDDLRKSERGQIWGFTIPLSRPVDAPLGALFGERFDEMVKTVEGRMLKRIAQEPGIPRREAVYQFPQQFAQLKQNLGEFLDTLFGVDNLRNPSLLRGVYFTSGTQEGRPIDQLAEKLRASFGLAPAAAPAAAAPTEQKSYFLRDVFARVVFPDQHIAALSPDEISRQKKQKYYIAAGAFGIAALLSIIPANAYLENKELVARADEAAQKIRDHVSRRANSPLTLAELQPLRDVVSELKGYHDGHAPIAMTFGMFQGEALYPKMSALYATAMQQHVINPLYLADVRDMQAFVTRVGDNNPPSTSDRQQYYDVLKLHLLLSQPHQSGEPALEGDIATFTSDQIAREWAARVSQGAPVDGRTQDAMKQNAQLFTGLLHDNPRLALARDQRTVSSVRAVLNRTSSVDIALNRIIADVEPMGYDVNLTRALGRSPENIYQTTPRPVRGAFTRQGWENYVRDRLKALPQIINGDAWVLGQAPNVDRVRQAAETMVQVRHQYFSQYIAEWRDFMASLRVNEPANAQNAHIMLQWFTGGVQPSAYPFLFRTLAENIHLNDPDTASANAAAESFLRVAERELNNRLNRTRSGNAANQVGRSALGARNESEGVSSFVHREDVERDAVLHGLVEFGVPPTPRPPAPAENGAPAPPPTPTTAPVNEYQEQLQLVRDRLYTYLNNPREASAPLMEQITTAQSKVESLINTAGVESRPVLRNLLPPPIEFTVSRTLGALGGAGSDRWCSAVVVPYTRTLLDHYPFNPNGQDAAIADVTQFYKSGQGLLWAFYGTDLAPYVPRVGDEYQFSTRLGHNTSEMYLPVLRDFLNRSQDVTTVLFPPQPPPPPAGQQAAPTTDGPLVEFEVRVRPTPTIAETTFTVDGEEVRYTNGPEEWHHFVWPGAGRQRGAKIRARGLNGIDETIEQDGEWGIFRLFEVGQVRGSANSRTFSVVWHLRDQNIDVGVDVRPARSENPFFGIPRNDSTASRYLSPFRGDYITPPHPISRSGRPCNLTGVASTGGAPSGRHHRSRH